MVMGSSIYQVSAYSIQILDTSRCKYAYPEYRASEVSEKYPSIHASPGLRFVETLLLDAHRLLEQRRQRAA
jgi:hypothetical protein